MYDNLTCSYDQFTDDLGDTHLPSFFLGTLLGNVFIYGASVGIIVCPLWGWILGNLLVLFLRRAFLFYSLLPVSLLSFPSFSFHAQTSNALIAPTLLCVVVAPVSNALP
jgi:hypothetical protein